MRPLLPALATFLAFAVCTTAATSQAASPNDESRSAAPRPNAPEGGKWQLSVETSAADGTKTIMASLPADAPIMSGFDQVTPTLVMRYHAGRASAYVLFDTFLGSGKRTNAVVTFGAEPAEVESWTISNDSRAVFPPGDALKFLTRLKHGDAFSIRVEPPKGAPVKASFTTIGVDVVIKAVIAAGLKYSE